jgi:hypothetical protein
MERQMKPTQMEVRMALTTFFSLVVIIPFLYFYKFVYGNSFRVAAVLLAEFIALSPFIYFIIGVSIDKKWVLTILNCDSRIHDSEKLFENGMACEALRLNYLSLVVIFILQSDFISNSKLEKEIYNSYILTLISVYIFTYLSASILTKIAGMYLYLIDLIRSVKSYNAEDAEDYKCFNITACIKANNMNVNICLLLESSILILMATACFIDYFLINLKLMPVILFLITLSVLATGSKLIRYLIINNILFSGNKIFSSGNLSANQLDSLKQYLQYQLRSVEALSLLILIANWYGVYYMFSNFI